MGRPVAGIDLGGTNITVGIASSDLVGVGAKRGVLGRSKKRTKADLGPEGVIDRIVDAVEDACDDAGIGRDEIGGVGIGAPGAIDHRKGVVIEAVNLRWNSIPLSELLGERFDVPVAVDNDVNVAVLGEARLGAGVGARDMLGVWLGTGIGGGLILDGSLYHGALGSAGEIGHMHVLPYNQPGSRSLEHNCSRTAVADRIARLIRSNRPSLMTELTGGDLTKIRSRHIAEAYKKNDELTRDVVDHAADLLGVAVGSVVTLLSVERVVLGGGLTEALGDKLVTTVRRAAKRVIFPDTLRDVEMVESELSDDAGVVGAALLALERSGAGATEPAV